MSRRCADALVAGLLAAALLVPIVAAARAPAFAGTVTRVSDGDTLWVRPVDRSPRVKVRLLGIDAPEICQPWGDEARRALEALALGRRVRVESVAIDDYGRRLARVTRGRDDLAAAMVRQGHAWSYRFRGHRGPYARQESAARDQRLGLFGDAGAVLPSTFRRLNGPCVLRAAASAAARTSRVGWPSATAIGTALNSVPSRSISSLRALRIGISPVKCLTSDQTAFSRALLRIPSPGPPAAVFPGRDTA